MEGVIGAVFFLVLVVIAWDRFQREQSAATTSRSRIVEYRNVGDANVGIADMQDEGWSVKSVDSTEGHINVGRTAAYSLATGGLALLLGGSRTSGKIIVTYERS